MPYSNSWEPNGLYRNFSGHIDGADILSSNLELHADSRFNAITYIINNFSDTTSHAIEFDHTRMYASTDAMIARTKHQLKIALVVPQSSLLTLAQRYCELMKEELFECDIFNSIEEARIWVAS